jgi:hypothetical protein
VYYAKVVCVANAGHKVPRPTDGITVDCTAPVEVEPSDIVIDVAHGPGPKISWANFVDLESTIHFYKVSLGTTPGAGQTQRTTHVGTAVQFVVSEPLMTFQDGRDYYATVVAYNRAGLQTSVTSNPFRLDRTPPEAGNVFVTDPWRLDDIRYNPTGLHSIHLAWDSFLDLHSSIVHYEIAVGTLAGSSDVHGFENVGLRTVSTAAPLTMTGGLAYYVSVKAVDLYGNEIIASSDPIVVDGDPPDIIDDFVKVDTLGTPDIFGTVYIQSFSALKLSWGDAFEDEESEIATYSVALGFDDCGSENIVAMHSVGLSKRWMLEGELQLSPITADSVLVATVRGWNRSGLMADICSPLIKVDESGPNPGKVFDGDLTQYVNSCSGSCKEINYQSSDSRIDAHWAKFMDDESGIVKYEWAVGRGLVAVPPSRQARACCLGGGPLPP